MCVYKPFRGKFLRIFWRVILIPTFTPSLELLLHCPWEGGATLECFPSSRTQNLHLTQAFSQKNFFTLAGIALRQVPFKVFLPSLGLVHRITQQYYTQHIPEGQATKQLLSSFFSLLCYQGHLQHLCPSEFSRKIVRH